ncbi:MAG: CopG family transcriptional regulator [Coriobacteriia bacterium]|nr:CopG family transcriptional regulator [Coriobacteriia bacterium]
MDAKKLEKKYGVTAQQIEEWSEAAERGEYPGVPFEEIIVGRPLLFGEELKPVTFKEPRSRIQAIDARAKSLNMSRSDYLRSLVEKDLADTA